MKGNRGITLIALVITIIVLLILAGVSINAIIGENGIASKAQEAGTETRAAGVEEARDIWLQERELAIVTGESPETMEEVLDELIGQDLLTEEEAETILTSEDNSITIGSKTISFSLIKKVEPEVLSDWEWIENDDGTATLVAYNGSDTNVIVPNYIDGLRVKSIKPKSPGTRTNGSIWGPDICSGNFNGVIMSYTPIQNTITSVKISEGIEEIGEFCFAGSHALTNISIPSTVKKIDDKALAWCISLTTVKIPESVNELYGSTFILSSLTEIQVDENNATYKDIDGILFSKDGTDLIKYPEYKAGISYNIPDDVTTLSENSFSQCEYLENLFIPKTVNTVERILRYGGILTVNVEYTEEEIPATWEEDWSKIQAYVGGTITVNYGVTGN